MFGNLMNYIRNFLFGVKDDSCVVYDRCEDYEDKDRLALRDRRSGNNIILKAQNGFDIVRLTAALLVTFSHSFTIKSGFIICDPLYNLTRIINFGHTGLVMFFTISGYLITKSWHQNPCLKKFIKKRILRIYPALIINGLFVLFIFIPLITWVVPTIYDLPFLILDYIKYSFSFSSLNKNYFQIFKNLKFTEINGSLWTLRYEVICYALIPILYLLKINRWFYLTILLCVILFFNIYSIQDLVNYNKQIASISLDKMFMFLWYFFLGHIVYLFKPTKSIYLYVCLVLIMMLIALKVKPYVELISYTVIASLTLFISIHLKAVKHRLLVDLSYGIYLYSFPIQQLIIYKIPNANAWLVFSITLLFALPLSYFSYVFVESKFLNKSYVIK